MSYDKYTQSNNPMFGSDNNSKDVQDIESHSTAFQVCIQCIIGLLIGCLGVARMSGDFKEIRAAAEMANK